MSVVKALPIRKWTREKETATTVEGESSTPPGGAGGAATAAAVMPQGYGTRTRRPAILECVVCLEDFVEGDVVITLPCHHEFHEVCMYPPQSPSPYLPRGPFSTFLFISSMSSISSRVILPTSVLLAYHIPCVSTRINNSTPWLTTRRRLCPICKRDIIAPSPLSAPTPTSELSPLLQNADHQGPSQDWRGDTAGQSAV